MKNDYTQFLCGINKKNIKVWEELYSNYYAALCSYVNNIIRNNEDAKDIVQDLLISLWKSSKKFEDMREFTSYLYRSCYNNSLIYLRNNKIRREIELKIISETEDFSEEMFVQTIREEILRQLYCYIKELPDGAREIIDLSIKGLSGSEIAEKLNITIHTVKTQKNRSFKFLRSKLKDTIYFFLI